MPERRHFPRVPVFFVLQSVQHPREAERTFQGVVKNLTPDGVLLETNTALQRDDHLTLSFLLPNSTKTLCLKAQVRWADHDRIWSTAGLEFQDLQDEEREAIMDYLITHGTTF